MKIWIALFSALLALSLIGCGGSGGGSSTEGNLELFQGNFTGTWTSTNSQNGTSTIAVSPDGSFAGTFFNATFNLTGTIEGQIVSDGSFQGTIALDGDEYTGDGEFTLSENNTVMTGHMIYNSITFNFNFARNM